MKKTFKEYALITIGVFMVAFAAQYITIPNEIAGGGVTGLSVVTHHYFPNISIELFSYIFNFFLFIVGFIFIGKEFGVKTIYAAFSLSTSLWLIKIFLHPVAITNDLILVVILSAAITGTGLAIVFSQSASTGGTDIIAKIFNKYFHLDLGKGMFVADLMVTIASGLTFGWEKGMYALVFVFLNGTIIDKVIQGFNVTKQVLIVSEKRDIISKYIIEDLKRGCTTFDGKGAYSKNHVYMLYSIMGRKEFIKLKVYMKEIDPKAFITVNEVYEVLGQGFNDI
ncbi:transporter [Clostridium putrefaciens]|uniref:Transporter n=1 Tax=Clostridium putrefaciens TaxID=99675 RepID=A0A381J6V7_9CLOT|nr:YitT family protein [Clostridium putrefaciens]SUY45866.1 transporter [Clostridium putrefaciens]